MLHICIVWDAKRPRYGLSPEVETIGYHHEFGSVKTITVFFSSLLCLTSIHYVFSLAALNSLITFSYTTNVREAAGRFFSRLEVMPL